MVIRYDWLFIEVSERLDPFSVHVTVHSWLWMEYACIPSSTGGAFSWVMGSLKGTSSSTIVQVEQACSLSTRSAWQQFLYMYTNSISLTYSLSDQGIDKIWKFKSAYTPMTHDCV